MRTFADYRNEAPNWITMADGEFYPDILTCACELSTPVLVINNQNSLQPGYPTEKNLKMVKRIIESSSNEGDLVMDCFVGSGTTLIAAEELNRQWNGVDIGNVAIETIQKRFQYGSRKLSEIDSGFKTNVIQGSLFEFSDDATRGITNSAGIKEKETAVAYDFYRML